jgi:hypothetical protein
MHCGGVWDFALCIPLYKDARTRTQPRTALPPSPQPVQAPPECSEAELVLDVQTPCARAGAAQFRAHAFIFQQRLQNGRVASVRGSEDGVVQCNCWVRAAVSEQGYGDVPETLLGSVAECDTVISGWVCAAVGKEGGDDVRAATTSAWPRRAAERNAPLQNRAASARPSASTARTTPM